jgi:hypothetical protein
MQLVSWLNYYASSLFCCFFCALYSVGSSFVMAMRRSISIWLVGHGTVEIFLFPTATHNIAFCKDYYFLTRRYDN